MRTTLAIDDALLAKAAGLTGLKERSALVREGPKWTRDRRLAALAQEFGIGGLTGH
jgi:Arc/MetJ family transcription regulator